MKTHARIGTAATRGGLACAALGAIGALVAYGLLYLERQQDRARQAAWQELTRMIHGAMEA